MAASHYHTNTKLPTIDRECLFNHPGHSSSPAPPVCLALPHFHVCPLAIGLAAVPFTAFGLQSKSRVDALCQVILSLGKSPTGHGKMALTCLHTRSDGWLPVSVAALVAQGPRALVLSEMCSCPNEQRWDVLFFISTQMQGISPKSSSTIKGTLVRNKPPHFSFYLKAKTKYLHGCSKIT